MAENKKEIEESQIEGVTIEGIPIEKLNKKEIDLYFNNSKEVRTFIEQALSTQKQEDKLNQEKREHTHQVSMQCARDASFELGKEKTKQDFEKIIDEEINWHKEIIKQAKGKDSTINTAECVILQLLELKQRLEEQ